MESGQPDFLDDRSSDNLHAERTNIVWVGVPLAPSVLQHFLQFENPAGEMASVLAKIVAATAAPTQIPEVDTFFEATRPNEDAPDEPRPAKPLSLFDEIREELRDVNKRAEGYNSVRCAAELAYRHFGADWLDSTPGSPGHQTREQLRKVVWDALSESHSNKSVPWRRFQDFAAEYGKVNQPKGR